MDAVRRRAYRAAVLLRVGDPVGKTIVRGDVINLRRWLVVPRTPGHSGVNGYDRALIARQNHSLRIGGIDPELVIIVATGRAFDRCPGFAPIIRTINRRVHYIDGIRVLWIDGDLFEIPAAVPDSFVG